MAQTNISWPGWKLGSLIGKGGFASVYEISRDEYGIRERAALKVITIPQDEGEIDLLRGEGLDNESISTQFKGHVHEIVNEYKMMKSLKYCPNIVHCDDCMVVEFEEGLGWNILLKMELLTPLLKALKQVNNEAQVIRLGIDLCNALDVCQKKGILHRDIKPQNIFLDEEGNFKLGDFGVARIAQHTMKATVGVGTYSFMAPEVLNSQPYGPSADIYSLGMVLYWLLNRRRGPFLPLPPDPYGHEQDEEAKRRRFSGEELPPPVNGSPELKQIVLKACAFDPSRRFAAAREMGLALQALLDAPEPDAGSNPGDPGPGEEDTTPEIPTDPEDPTGKTLWIVLLCLLAGLLLCGLLALALFLLPEKPPADDPWAPAQTTHLTEPAETAPPTTAAPATEAPTVPETEAEAETVPPVTAPPTEAPAAAKTYAQIDGGRDHTVVLYTDGTVAAVGGNGYGQCDVAHWRDITAISTLRNHTVGLKADGTVVAAGDNSQGQCNVEDWRDIIAVSAGDHHTVGLRRDGTVVSTGKNHYGECDVEGWRDVVSVAASFSNTFGLRSDGTVLAAGAHGSSKLHGWENIRSLSASDAHVAGLRADGTVRAVGSNTYEQCDVSKWKNVTQVAAGCGYTVALKSNGTLYYLGIKEDGLPGVKQWQDIQTVATGMGHIIGIREDGSLVAAGDNEQGQCDVEALEVREEAPVIGAQTAPALCTHEFTVVFDDNGDNLPHQICRLCGAESENALIPLGKFLVLADTNANENSRDVLIGTWKDGEGNTYSDAVKFWVISKPGFSNTEAVEFYLGKQSSWFYLETTTEAQSHKDSRMTVTVYGDGELLQTYEGITPLTWINDTLYVQDVTVLRIECSTQENVTGYCIVDGSLS